MHLSLPGRAWHWTSALAIATSAGLAVAPSALARSHPHPHANPHTKRQAPGHTIGHYTQRNLVADTAGSAELQDPDVVNAWGLAFGPTTPAWISDFGASRSTLYAGAVNGSPVRKPPLIVTVPGMPTGQVFNGASKFAVRSGAASGPATFVFATATGTIVGWNTNVPAPGSTAGQTAVTVPGAEFTGLAIAGDNRLYAADFHNARIDVWDGSWARVKSPRAFRDPKLPSGYAPFGVETAGRNIVVTYAKQDARAQLDVAGAGHGFVDMYTKSGRLVSRFASRGTLNSPWGVAQAPTGFGAASGAMLIGNFGDGHINAFSPRTGRFLGQLADASRQPISIEGLWALKFGNGVIGAPNQLLFTAGPSQGMHGLFGELTATTGKATGPSAPSAPTAPSAPSMPTMPGY